MRKILTLGLIISCIGSTMIPLVANASFLDVSPSSQYAPAIQYLEDTNIVPADKTRFLPSKTISRGELYELAWRAAGYFAAEKSSIPTGFQDVSSNSRFAPYVRKAVETGILKTKDRFLPNEKVSRIEALRTIFDTMGIGITRVYQKNEITFKDLKNNPQWAPLGKTALEFGIMADQQNFKPNAKATHAEIADMIYKIGTQLENNNNGSSGSGVLKVIQYRDPGEASTFVTNPKFKTLQDIWDKIHQKFVFQNRVDDDKLVQGAINGMVNKLGDKYTVYQEPTAAKSFNEALTGEFEGIGISIDQIDGKVKVVSPIKDAPAYKAGIKPNDIITEVNKESMNGLNLSEVTTRIKGPKGTSVELTIERDGKKLTFKIKRERIKLDPVEGEMKDTTAVITIRNFTEDSGILFGDTVKKMLENKPKKLVIDLRDNPGGYLDASLAMLDHFFPKHTRLASIMFASKQNAADFLAGSTDLIGRSELDPVNPEIVLYSIGDGELHGLPTTVIINGGSASASEIMTAALRENNQATVIGEDSFGKGTVQEITDYTDGSMYKQTIGKWQTPLEHNLTEHPMHPDVKVIDDPSTVADEQLEYAVGH